MKLLSSFSLFILAMAPQICLAQNAGFNPGASVSANSGGGRVSTKGIRFSVIRPELSTNSTMSYLHETTKTDGKIEDALGLALGYAYLPVMSVGWTANAAAFQLKDGGERLDLARLDANLAFAFTETVNLKAGVSASKFTSGALVKDLNVGMGAQASLGVQVNHYVAFDLGYSYMKATGRPVMSEFASTENEKYSDLTLETSGLELSLAATF